MKGAQTEHTSSQEQIRQVAGSYRIGIIGLGKIGLPMAEGLLRSGLLADGHLLLSNRDASETHHKVQQLGNYAETLIADNNDHLVRSSDIVIVALKQSHMRDEMRRWRDESLELGDKLIVSFAAGVRIRTIKRWMGTEAQPVARVMPNTPVAVGRGVFGWTLSDEVQIGQKRDLETLLAKIGTQIYVEKEDMIDVITSVSGSGPAYFYLLAELMINEAIRMGLTDDQAHTVVSETFTGAALYYEVSGIDVAQLRRNITSPNGTTEAAVASFVQNRLDEVVSEALKAARKRGADIGEAFDKGEM